MLVCVTRLDFLKSHFKGPKYTIKKSSFARKRKKLICGTEGEIVVAHGRLPSPLAAEAIVLLQKANFYFEEININLALTKRRFCTYVQ